MGRHGLGNTVSNNGERLKKLAASWNLFIGGTRYRHPDIHKYTWQSPDGKTRNQIDHILISRKYHNTLLDVRTRRGADIYSDHNLVVAQLRLRPAAIKIFKPNAKFNISRLQDPVIATNFQRRLHEETASFLKKGSWGQINDACKQVATEILGAQRGRRKPWLSDATWEKIEQRRAIKSRLSSTTNGQLKRKLTIEYNTAQMEIKKLVKNDKINQINHIADEAETAAYRNDLRGVFSAIRSIVNVKPNIPPLKDVYSNVLTSDEQQLQRWKQFFETPGDTNSIMESQDAVKRTLPNRNISTDPPSLAEVRAAIQKLKNNKAGGTDNIPAEILKCGAEQLAPILQRLLKEAWSTEQIPKDWKEGVIVMIPKKGDLSLCKNWRGITLLNTIQKVLAFIILDRIFPTLNVLLRCEQNGFRPRRSCVDHVNTLRIIVEQSAEWHSPLFLLFVDFERAFDTINRNAIWEALITNGVPDKVTSIIKELYSEAESSVRFKGKNSEKFEIANGVRQGCVLSPLLFILVLDGVLRKTDREAQDGIQWNLFQKLSDLDYADDICFLSHSLNGTRKKLESLVENARLVGLKVNMNKTKLMRMETTVVEPLTICLGADTVAIEDVGQFTYLGSVIAKDGGADADVDSRISKARSAFFKLKKIWDSSVISRNTKLRIYNTSVKSVLLYGSETWKVTDAICNKLMVFNHKCLRKICRVFWPNIISNEDLYVLTKSMPTNSEIKKRKWSWIGHTLRKDNTDIAKMAFEWNPQGKRARGRPKMTWVRTVRTESESFGSWSQIRSYAYDRRRWNRLVAALCSD